MRKLDRWQHEPLPTSRFSLLFRLASRLRIHQRLYGLEDYGYPSAKEKAGRLVRDRLTVASTEQMSSVGYY